MSRQGARNVKPWLQTLIFLEFYLGAWPNKLAAQRTSSPPLPNEDDAWTWCVKGSAEKAFCDSMTEILAAVDPDKKHVHNCVVGNREDGCVQMVAAGQAKFVVLDGAEIYKANAEMGLIPIRVEVSRAQGTYHYGVAVVKKGRCPQSLHDLKGKRSCHAGYGTAVGWILPVTKLVAASVMSVVISGPAQTDIQSVRSFFSKTCAADGKPKTSLCSACNVTRGCTTSDAYCSEAGAFRGLVEGSCDVAFTKHTIPALYAVGGANADRSWNGLGHLGDYQILCPKQLSSRRWCTDAGNFRSCNWGSAPGRTVMTDPRWPAIKEFNKVLDLANNSSQFQDLLYSGNYEAGMLFSPDTVRLDAFTKNTATRLGPLYNDIQSLERMNTARSTSKAMSPVALSEAPSFDPVPSPGDDQSISHLVIGGIIAGGILALLVTGGLLFLICLCRKRPSPVIKPPTPSGESYSEHLSPSHLRSDSTGETYWTPSVASEEFVTLPSVASEELVTLPGLEGLPKGDGPHNFSLYTLKVATDNFHPRNRLGQGGSGSVYKGVLSDGVTVAVKQLSRRSALGREELLNEVHLIIECSHKNLVKLHGYCLEGDERLLVYEYLEGGSLHDALSGQATNQHALAWPARFKIIVETARGLMYLHHHKEGIIHGNVKATNILLDRDLSPKISDSCLAKLLLGDESHIHVAGTFGYIAREHAVLSGQLTKQSDVFSFGILMLENFCGRQIVDLKLPSEEALLSWIWQLYETGKILEALDSRLREEEDLPHQEVHKVVKVALLCTQSAAQMRPTIQAVLSMLVGETSITSIPIRPDYLHPNSLSTTIQENDVN